MSKASPLKSLSSGERRMAGKSRTRPGRIAAVLLVLFAFAPVARVAAVPTSANDPVRLAHDSVVRVMAIYPLRTREDGTQEPRPRAHVSSGVVMDAQGDV